MRSYGTAAGLEERRRFAIELMGRGFSTGEVATQLQVTSRSVRRWARAARNHGPDALRARPAPGRSSKLTAAQKRKLVRAIRKHPEWKGKRWTRDRIAWLIKRGFGITYSPAHLSRLLRNLGLKARRPYPSFDPDRPVDRRTKVWRYRAKVDPLDTT